MNRYKTLLRLLGMIRSLWGVMIFSVTMRTLNQLGGIAILTYGAWGVGSIIRDGSVTLRPLIITLVIMGMLKGIFRYLEQFSGHYVAFHLLAHIRNKLYEKLEPLAPAGLMKSRSGDVISRAIADVNRIEVFYAHTIAPATVAILAPAVALYALAQFDILLVWILLPFLLGVGLIAPWISDRLGNRYSLQLRPIAADVSAHLTDSVQGLREIVAFGYGDKRKKEIRDGGERLARAQSKLAHVTGIQNAATDIFISLGILSVVAAGLALVQQGALDILHLPAVLALSTTIFVPVLASSNVIHEFNQAMSGATRLFEIMDQAPVVKDEAVALPPEPIVHSIHFKNVSFSYPKRGEGDDKTAPTLKEIDFDIPVGKTTALVGPSGSGKSTIVNLLLRFWDVDEGEVRIGDYDLRHYPQEELRRKIAVVSQQTHIFNLSIKENLLLGNPKATKKELEEVARLANIHEFISSLPEGYDTVVGEMGAKLSGGQRQRLAIARALLKDAPILILDEATSNLDSETEKEIQNSLSHLMQGRTTLVIAHRLSTVLDADEILVLEKGEIVERGKHKALLEKGGVYSRLYLHQ